MKQRRECEGWGPPNRPGKAGQKRGGPFQKKTQKFFQNGGELFERFWYGRKKLLFVFLNCCASARRAGGQALAPARGQRETTPLRQRAACGRKRPCASARRARGKALAPARGEREEKPLRQRAASGRKRPCASARRAEKKPCASARRAGGKTPVTLDRSQ